MRLHHHTAFSVILSGILYLMFKSWAMSLSCLISGIFIDIDHFIDVIREHGWHVRVRSFFRLCHENQFDQILLLFHGWEWLALLGVSTWLTNWNPWMTGAFIGLGAHLILDAFHNSTNFLSYSIIWRWRRDFHFDTVFSNLKGIKYKYKSQSSNGL